MSVSADDYRFEWDVFYPSTPITYTIEITNQCNANCEACGNVNPHSPFHLSSDKWITLIEKIRHSLSYLRISGGEPTLSPDFFKIVHYTQTLNIPFSIFTNGYWQHQHDIIQLFKQSSNLSALLISLHGPNANSHNNFMGVSCFDAVINNIKIATKNGIVVNTNTVFTKWNLNQYEQIAQLSTDLGAKTAVFSRYYGPQIPSTNLTKKELKDAVLQIEEMRAEGLPVRLNNCVPLCFTKNSTSTCQAGFTFCTIDVAGNVRPCNHSSIIFGNVFEQPMEEIWSSEAADRWRNSIPTVCFSCVELQHCGGGCRAMQEFTAEKTDPLIREPLLEPHEKRIIRLPGTHKPRARYQSRREQWGYLLFRQTKSLPVSFEAKEMLNNIDNTLTVSQIKSKYGMEMLQLLGALFEKNLIEFIS